MTYFMLKFAVSGKGCIKKRLLRLGFLVCFLVSPNPAKVGSFTDGINSKNINYGSKFSLGNIFVPDGLYLLLSDFNRSILFP